MTNREKFKKVFGIEVKWSDALSPQIAALSSIQLKGISCAEEWLNAEYVPRHTNQLAFECPSIGQFCVDIESAVEVFEDSFTALNTHGHYTEAEEQNAMLSALIALNAVSYANELESTAIKNWAFISHKEKTDAHSENNRS